MKGVRLCGSKLRAVRRSAIIPLLVSVLWWLCLCDCRAFTGPAAPAKVAGLPRSASKNPLRLPNEPNPFDLFGVKRGTEKAEIRKLFRKRVQTEHPDVNPNDPEAAERFQELVGAYNSIMGDELLPDELNFVRVQMTKRYKKELEADQSVNNGIFYALLPGMAVTVIGIWFFAMDALGMLDPQTKQLLDAVKGKGAPFTAVIPNRKKSGELFLNLLDVRGLTVARETRTGEDLWYLIGIQADVSELGEEDMPDDHFDELQKLSDFVRERLMRELSTYALSNSQEEDGQTAQYELLACPVWRPGDALGSRGNRHLTKTSKDRTSPSTGPAKASASGKLALGLLGAPGLPERRQKEPAKPPEQMGNLVTKMAAMSLQQEDALSRLRLDTSFTFHLKQEGPGAVFEGPVDV
ncbi:DJP1 [Symbiodinium sp. KB8]|nr:DJP1 [Symbiodinium sp. KB8]